MTFQKSRFRESCGSKVATLLGALLQLLLVAIPKDFVRWMGLRRKCVRGQTVVITGGASGIGQRMAELFADPGGLDAQVAIIDSNSERAEQVVQGICHRGGRAQHWRCDIVDAGELRHCAAEIQKQFGKVDIVICNAAILYFAHTLELTDEEMERALKVNVLGTLNTIRAFLPEMEKRDSGQIVTISSITAFFGETFGMAYCPTKFAVRGAMECLRMELRDRGLDGIVCTTICPFFVRTPMILAKGIRPVSRWIPFMSIERCANQIVDAVLKEKVLAFMPGWLGTLTVLNGLFTLNMQRIARDFINIRFEDPDEPLGAGEEQTTIVTGCSASDEEECESQHKCPQSPPPLAPKRQLRDHFGRPGIVWCAAVPLAQTLLLLAYFWPQFFSASLFSSIGGESAHQFATAHRQMLLLLNVALWAVRLGEAVVALFLADFLRLSHKSALFWFLQTLVLGCPSLRLLLKLRAKSH